MEPKSSHESRSDFLFDSICVLAMGAATLWLGLRSAGVPAVVSITVGAAMLAGGGLLWAGRLWARWPVAAALGLVVALQLAKLADKGFSWITLMLAGFAVWFAWDVLRKFRPRPESPDRPMTSVAIWLRKPRYLDPVLLATYFKAVWGREFKADRNEDPASARATGGGESDCWVVGTGPFNMANTPHGMFVVHNHDRPYMDEPDKAAEGVKDLRIHYAITECRGWMAVDYMGGGFADRREAYPWIAKLVAELAGPDVLAIYLPETEQVLPWTDELEEKLRSDSVFELFGSLQQLPVVRIDDRPEALEAAEAEARARWPEFLEAFNTRSAEGFSVKVPLTRGGRTEHIWVEVDAISGESVSGRLGNDPVDLDGLRLGSPVTVPVSGVEDWAFLRNGEMVGAFTAAAVAAAYREGDKKA